MDKELIKEVVKEMFKSGEIQVVAKQDWIDKDITVSIKIGDEVVAKCHEFTAPCGSHRSCLNCGTLSSCSYKG